VRIEHEYERNGALQYLATWDVRRGYVMGRCEPTTGIEPFGRLLDQVLAQEPYRSRKCLLWIVDNGSSHRGDMAKQRLHQVDSRIIRVLTTIYASWLKQVEIYVSIIHRKVLTPNAIAVEVRPHPTDNSVGKDRGPSTTTRSCPAYLPRGGSITWALFMKQSTKAW
jgi:hypothetical protein